MTLGQAWAGPTTADQAQRAVHGWLRTGHSPLRSTLGSAVARVDTFADAAGQPAYYVVHLNPSGFVVVPADDEVEPIICFAASGTYDPSSDNPLGALVSRDLPGRLLAVRGQAGVTLPQAERSVRSGKWQRLQSYADNVGTVMMISGSVSDVRVAPFVQSRWNQQTENGLACYNYYTPPGPASSTSNYPSGCVATAMAQVMRYLQYPTAGIGVHPFTISVGPDTQHLTSQQVTTRGGDGAGGSYKWTLMMLDPDYTITPSQCEAIGALCYDAGVAVKMQYTPGSSGAFMSDCRTAMTSTFGFKNTIYGYNNNATIPVASLQTMMDPNLDAGYPIILGIEGVDNVGITYRHAIVSDGYGYDSSSLYHHLNMGWGGYRDAWYNLPMIDPSLPPPNPPIVFNTVTNCLYNIYTSGSGEIISGRVTDPAGSPLAGPTVTAQRGAGGTYTATTGANGIYALPNVPSSSSYTLRVTGSIYAFSSRTASTGTSMNNSTICGNCWATDFQGQIATPPTASDVAVSTVTNLAVAISLPATDDGAPNPPGALSCVVTSLPAHGNLSDPGGGAIVSVPYTLASYGNTVNYTPAADYAGSDSFSFKANDGGTAPTGGDSVPATVTVDVRRLLCSANMDVNPGWTTTGLWAWGKPTGQGGDRGGADPTSGYTGTNVYGYNLNGGYTNNMTPQYLTTTAINCSNCSGIHLRFRRWLCIDSSQYDHASVQATNNIADPNAWVTVWDFNGPTLTETSWSLQEYDISSVADGKPAVYIRWVMGPTNASRTYGGWNIDDVEVTGRSMPPAAPASPQPADGQAAIPVSAGLSWNAGQTESGVTYDVYLDTFNPPTLQVSAGQTGLAFTPVAALQEATTYYWQVIARNSGGQTAGAVWSFRTHVQGDLNNDGYVNVGDLQLLVAKWGAGPGFAGPEDINGDGYVNVGDLQLLVARWGQS